MQWFTRPRSRSWRRDLTKIPNPKLQAPTTPNPQIPRSFELGGGGWELGVGFGSWTFGSGWDLELGIWDLAIALLHLESHQRSVRRSPSAAWRVKRYCPRGSSRRGSESREFAVLWSANSAGLSVPV